MTSYRSAPELPTAPAGPIIADLTATTPDQDIVQQAPSRRVQSHLRQVSDGNIVGLRRSGPVFGPSNPRRRQRTMLRPALPRGARITVAALSVCWVLTLLGFSWWWLRPAHRLGWPGFVTNTLVIAMALLLSAYFLRIVNRMQRVDPATPLPRVRIAMVVTKAPSEPWPLVRSTLIAMLRQDYPGPYDVWLADEDPTDETVSWCTAHDVSISTRRGVAAYQRTTWPRRRRCKEGNLAFFYDHVGYGRYDVVSQLDSDHVPARGYLREMVRPFADPNVGYVAAPSVCDANAASSWAVRGRPYEEASFHGAQQLGLNRDGTPVCIGSHYAVRTAALREIGGLGPELAEDFSTSYLLNVAGWRGVFAIDAEAHGDGPPDFAAMVTQEFQWARSLTTLMLGLVLRTCHRLPGPLAIRFVFQSGIYVILAAMTGGGVALLTVASVARAPWVSVNFLLFFALWFTMGGWLLAINLVLRRHGLIRPTDAPLVSWEQALYVASRWPFTAMGVIAALVERVVPRTLDFKVTPKGASGPQRFPVRLVVPFCGTATLLAVCAYLGLGSWTVIGYVGLALLMSCSQVLCAVVVLVLHSVDARRNTGIGGWDAVRLIRRPLILCLATGLLTAAVSVVYLGELYTFLKANL